jgi:hypothetical protein
MSVHPSSLTDGRSSFGSKVSQELQEKYSPIHLITNKCKLVGQATIVCPEYVIMQSGYMHQILTKFISV